MINVNWLQCLKRRWFGTLRHIPLQSCLKEGKKFLDKTGDDI